MTRTTRIRDEYSNPNSREINGQSTQKNIRLMAERASELSDGHRHRAENGAMDLPSTTSRNGPRIAPR
jgi:hypothetical protein